MLFASATDTIITEGFLLVPTLFFALGCWVATFLIRKVVETAYKPIKGKPPYETKLQEWWHEVILFALPAVIGVIGALSLRSVEVAGQRIIPVMFSSWQGAILFGLVVGFFCSLIYKAFKQMFFKRLGVKTEEELPKATVPKPPGDDDKDDEEEVADEETPEETPSSKGE
jgi:hypothetical protein